MICISSHSREPAECTRLHLCTEQKSPIIVEHYQRLHALHAPPTLCEREVEVRLHRHPYVYARNEWPSVVPRTGETGLHDQHRNAPTYFESLQNRLRAP